MSTRGLVGWVIDGGFHASYNHNDSYPSGLGREVATFVVNLVDQGLVEALRRNMKKLTPVSEEQKVPPDLQKKYSRFFNDGVSTQSKEDWYCTLRSVQGAPLFKAALSGDLCHFIEGKTFLRDSLFCEWAYVLNFDTNSLEVYKGVQKKAPKHNVLVEDELGGCDKDYHACERIRNVPFDKVYEDNWIVKACFKGEEIADEDDYDVSQDADETLVQPEEVPAPAFPTITVYRSVLAVALHEAIRAQEEHEARLGWNFPSAYLATIRQMFNVLNQGGSISLKEDQS